MKSSYEPVTCGGVGVRRGGVHIDFDKQLSAYMCDIYECVAEIPSWTRMGDSYFLFNHHQNSAGAAANV